MRARENTIIDGGAKWNKCYVPQWSSGETMLSVLSGFTIQNGNSGGAGS